MAFLFKKKVVILISVVAVLVIGVIIAIWGDSTTPVASESKSSPALETKTISIEKDQPLDEEVQESYHLNVKNTDAKFIDSTEENRDEEVKVEEKKANKKEVKNSKEVKDKKVILEEIMDAKQFQTTANLNLREGASLSQNVITTIPIC